MMKICMLELPNERWMLCWQKERSLNDWMTSFLCSFRWILPAPAVWKTDSLNSPVPCSLKDGFPEFSNPLQFEWMTTAICRTGWQLQFERLDDNCSFQDWMATAVCRTGWQLQFVGLDDNCSLKDWMATAVWMTGWQLQFALKGLIPLALWPCTYWN